MEEVKHVPPPLDYLETYGSDLVFYDTKWLIWKVQCILKDVLVD